MKAKIEHILFSAFFMLMLVIPLLFTNWNGGAVSAQENRFLAARPQLAHAIKYPYRFASQLNNWLTDNVGFRADYIRLYNNIERLNINKVHYTDGHYIYLIGQEGHHYFAHTNGKLIPKFQGKEYLSDDQLQGLADGLNKTEQYLDERNIAFVVLLCPDKESVYPEYYPQSIIRNSEISQLDLITEYVKSSANVDVFNIRQRLISEKADYQTYNKAVGDLTHFNRVGAFIAYLELIERIKNYFPGIRPFTFDDIEIEYSIHEVPTVTLKPHIEITYTEFDMDFFDNVEVRRPFTWESRAFENYNQDLPTILFMRDSCADFFIDFIVPHFGQAIFMHYQDMRHFEDYIALYKPDIVVFESAERELQTFANIISQLKNLE